MSDPTRHAPEHSRQAALETAADRTALAAILDARGHHDDARTTLRHALAVLETALGSDHFEVGTALDQLAEMVARDGGTDAVALYDRALSIFERTLGSQHPRTVRCRAARDIADERSQL